MSAIQLRPFQHDGVEGIRSNFRAGNKKVLFVLPTGGGKTACFSHMAFQTITNVQHPGRVLILTDRKELLDQANGSLSKFGIRAEHIIAGNKAISKTARCYIGMVETYHNRLVKARKLGTSESDWLLSFNLIVVDEAHKGNFRKTFNLWKTLGYAPYVVGATATPLSAKRSDPLSNYYDALVNPVQVNELIEQGWLVPAVTYAAKVDRSKLKADESGEYTDESQMDLFASRQVYGGLIDKYRKYGTAEGQPLKAVVFNVNIKHSLEVCSAFNDAGIAARHVDGNTDETERDALFAAHKRGEFPILCNVGVATTGYDDTSIRVVIVNRATTSKALWLQMVGRGGRPHPGKDHFVLLDMGDNYKELDLWENPVDWESLWCKVRKKKDKLDVAPVRTCPEETCGAIMPMSAKVCTACGYAFPKPAPAKLKEVEFEKVSDGLERLKNARKADWNQLAVDELWTLAEMRKYQEGWILHVLRERSADEEAFRQQTKQLELLNGKRRGWAKRVPYKLDALTV
ncbi:DEAD/DEAH box helicase [Spirosoma arcticum]